MTTRVIDIHQEGTHAARPAGSAAPNGALYSCSDHNKIYRNVSGTWEDYASVGGDKVEFLMVALGDETTALTTGTAKMTMRMPFGMTLTEVRANVNTVSSSGLPTVDIKQGGASVLSTLLTIDASEKTSTTATTPAVISTSALTDDAEITFDVTVAGTGAKGLKVTLIGTR